MIRFSVALLGLACSTAWAADYRALDVKPGQWQTTISGQTSGMPRIPDELLNRLTPEQRAKMQAASQAMGGGSTPIVHKGCLTKDQLDKPFNLGDDNTKSCARTLVTSSGNKQEIIVDCTREATRSKGTIKVEAVDSENIKGSMQMTVINGEHTMNMNYAFASKWIGPVCADK